MKVRCTLNNFLELKDSSVIERLKKYIHISDGQLNLEVNREYRVYGIQYRERWPWYYLCLDHDDCPTAYPAELFDITDGDPSLYWHLSDPNIENLNPSQSMVIKEWAQDELFYERLVDGDPSAIKTFYHYKQLMDNE